jgi:hypothetical protein
MSAAMVAEQILVFKGVLQPTRDLIDYSPTKISSLTLFRSGTFVIA